MGALGDFREALMQGLVLALEQLEPGGEARLDPAKGRKIVTVLDLMMLLELPQQHLQMAREPGAHTIRRVLLVEGVLAAAAEQIFELAGGLMALQPEARERAEPGVAGPAVTGMLPRQKGQLLAQCGR
jgi:hypothetical protein